jgi:hypothetical protein
MKLGARRGRSQGIEVVRVEGEVSNLEFDVRNRVYSSFEGGEGVREYYCLGICVCVCVWTRHHHHAVEHEMGV